MTEKGAMYIPFPGVVLKTVRPISTITIIRPFERGITGCGRKCACRLWPNCSYYNKMKWKKSRRDGDETLKDIWEYYNNTFKLTVEMPIANMNG